MNSQTIKMTLIVIGSAIAGILLFIAVIGTFAYFKFNKFYNEPYQEVAVPPAIPDKHRFLGTTGLHMSGFKFDTQAILAKGPSKLIGNVTASDKPVEGLKIRLALNGEVYSQWGITDKNGKYSISVPPGEYKVYGYELEFENANSVLGGKIEKPYNSISTDIFKLAKGEEGRALDLKYVSPVSNIKPKGEYSLSNPVSITWDPYPNAS